MFGYDQLFILFAPMQSVGRCRPVAINLKGQCYAPVQAISSFQYPVALESLIHAIA